uniref:Spermatogenesis associated 6 n=1 Tax=Heterorhabditis bacteriophora TaxID=37862 RepID=A0A1I7X301_HETBA
MIYRKGSQNTHGVLDRQYMPFLMFRPKTSRVASVLSDGDKKIYTRTRSMDRKQLRGEDHDYGSQIRNRLTTPEVIPDYTYVNYHDSSNGRSGSQIKDDKGQPKSILKNKQNAEVEPRTDSGSNRAVEGGIGPVRSVFVRLRRHLSLEKSASPQRQTMLPRIQETPGVSTPSLGGNLRDSLGTDTNEDYPKKKRSILAFNRRRTSDMRLGTEGKLITNGYDDLQFKRPSSPIDKLKSLFRKTDSIQTPQHTGGDYYTKYLEYIHLVMLQDLEKHMQHSIEDIQVKTIRCTFQKRLEFKCITTYSISEYIFFEDSFL